MSWEQFYDCIFVILTWIGNWLGAVAQNPVWALFFGAFISLAIWRRQTFLSHRLVENDAKRELYREFIRQIDPAAFGSKPEDTYVSDIATMRLSALSEEIYLLSSKELGDASAKVLSLAINFDDSVDTVLAQEKLHELLTERSNFTALAKSELEL